MKYVKKTLKNGLRVILVPVEGAMTVTAMVAVEAGSEYETKDINGLSHFLEHMCFKGTERRPSTLHISQELDALGADYNAFTGQEYTGYYAKAHPKHFGTILDVVSDIYLNSTFPEAEIEKEKNVVVEEINMNMDNPQRQIFYDFLSLLYGDQPAGWPITGPKETVRSLSRDALLAYRANHYVASSTMVVIAGAFEPDRALREVEARFAGISAGPKKGKAKTRDSQKETKVALRHKDSDQTHLILGVRAYPADDKRNDALNVLNSALGEGMSSRLWQKVRNELGLGYYVYSFSDPSLDRGYFAVAAGVDNARVPEAVEAVMGVLREFRSKPLGADELAKAKDHHVGSMYLGLETTDSLGWFYANQEILERRMLRPERIAKDIKSVTADDVRAVARDLLKTPKLNLALIGKYSDEAKLKELLKF